MTTVSEKFRAARARAARALDDVDRARAMTALALALAAVALATLNPTPETFHDVCLRSAHAQKSLAEKFLPVRATRAWACSNGGFLRAVRLRAEAFTVADLLVASIARVRDGAHYLGCLGTWFAVPRFLNPLVTLVVHVYRVHATVFACVLVAAVGATALKALRMVKTLVFAAVALVAGWFALPRACGAPLWSILLCVAAWGAAYKMKKLDGLVRAMSAIAPPPGHGRRPRRS